MNLDPLDCVLAVAEEQNLTRAARKLYISQPTLTARLNRLEQELGVRLFDRTVSPVRITKAGLLYLQRMKHIRQESEALLHDLRQLAQEQTVFHFGIGSTRGSHWLPLVLPEFCALHPDVSVQLHEQGEDFLEEGLRKGEIDLAVGVLHTGSPELRSEELAQEVVYLAIPRTFPCVAQLPPWSGTPTNPHVLTGAEVGTIPFLLPRPGSGFHHCAAFLLEEAGLRPGRQIQYTNMNTAWQLAGAGVGALFVTPDLFLAHYPDVQRNLAFCTLRSPPYVRHSTAVWRPDSPREPLIADMLRLIRERILPRLGRF